MRALCLVLVAVAWWAAGLARAEGAQALSRAEIAFDTGRLPPGELADWRPVALPDAWRLSRPDSRADRAWYRLRFEARPSPGELLAVYLPKLVMNAEVYLNGVLIGSGGRFEEPVARNWNRPLLFLVPPGLMWPGENTLHIRLRAHPYTQAALHPVWVGPERALRVDHERAYFLNITVNQTATLLIAAIGVLTLSLWLRRRRDTAYAYFGASAVVWAGQSVNLYLRDPPVSTAHWEILSNAGFQVFSAWLLISLLRFVGAGGRPLVTALWGAAVLAPASLWAVPAEHYLRLTAAWHLFTLAAAGATLVLLARAALRRDNREARYLVAAMCLVLAFALHDWLIHSQHLWLGDQAWPLRDVFLLQYSAPAVFLAIGLIMTGRFVRVVNEFEALNDQLEHRVAAKQAELQASFARMRQLETEQAVAEERERIYRDLHDDVGAKLLSLVYRAGTPADADLARSALQDLRDVVSRTGSESYDLDAVMADWRVECESRLAEAGLTLDWRHDTALDGFRLTQPQALDLGRILREAVSNVIRHAQARRVEVRLHRQGDQLCLSVRDDGIGPGQGPDAKPGRGLRNMAMRAARLGGTFQRDGAEPHGTRITICIPMFAGVTAHTPLDTTRPCPKPPVPVF